MKVMVGLSGGVDSAVATYLLQKQGYDVICAFMRNWDAMANNDVLGNPTIEDSQCPQEKDYEDAKEVAKILGVKLHRIDFIKEYWNDVFSLFIDEYNLGRTPNPDILCNKFIKFDAFLKYAKANGCDMIAMGHYAKKVEKNGHTFLAKCADQNKDQTYFLSQLSEEQIKSCLFPLGDIKKDEVRMIAHKLHLNIADKKDSTGVCFIGERDFREFLKNYIPAQKGDIVDIETGRILGEHDGVLYYTLGQRKGLGIGGIPHEKAIGWFVCKKDVKKNILYVAKGEENAYLYSDRCLVNHLNFVIPLSGSLHVGCKFRYRQADQGVTIKILKKDCVEVLYDKPYKAVTPGQEAVFYDGEILIGSGTIDEVFFQGHKIE